MLFILQSRLGLKGHTGTPILTKIEGQLTYNNFYAYCVVLKG